MSTHTMAFNNPSTPPTVIDDDINRTVATILKTSPTKVNDNDKVESGQVLSPELYPRLLDSLSVAMQTERNGWKEKLHSTLQEMDRQHRASIAVQASLQEMVDSLSIQPLLHSPHSDSSCSGRKSSDLISGLYSYIQDLQEAVTRATRGNNNSISSNNDDDIGCSNNGIVNASRGNNDTNINTTTELKPKKDPSQVKGARENQLESKLKDVQASLAELEKEKMEHTNTIKERMKEIAWLHKELNAIKNQLHKLRRIVLNYNESHSTHFHLDNVEIGKEIEASGQRGQLVSRERTYLEGDQLEYFATPGEEIALWKLRAKQNVLPDSRRGNLRTGIAQCLRCQKLFKPNENNGLACRYHKKGREIREVYDGSGRLSKVLYKWACCKRDLDAPGCTHGYHI